MMDLYLPPKPAIIRPHKEIIKASFLPGMFPAGAVASAGPLVPATLTWTDATSSASSLTTYTFTGRSIGAADSTRRVFAAIGWAAISSRSLSSATIGGISATIHFQSPSGFLRAAIVSALVPTGTTATVSYTFSGAVTNSYVSLFRLIGENVSSPIATAEDRTFTGNDLSTNISVAESGVVIGVTGQQSDGPTGIDWTNLTERNQSGVIGPNMYSSAGNDNLASGSLSVTATHNHSGSIFFGALTLVSWQ